MADLEHLYEERRERDDWRLKRMLCCDACRKLDGDCGYAIGFWIAGLDGSLRQLE